MYCDFDVFVYSVFVFYFKMTCFISSCPVTDLGSQKCICMYVCISQTNKMHTSYLLYKITFYNKIRTVLS
jgi:hypothetical protein